ncbi:hypothetical protein HDG34_004118 [Paraburkholderia sp. HC6.4b]|nr:hypothetical protein [Paraburkholderia sp. HC6.4b]MBB5451920.1 hypothetical protein [Paraburkholderia sp. Kb1A]
MAKEGKPLAAGDLYSLVDPRQETRDVTAWVASLSPFRLTLS